MTDRPPAEPSERRFAAAVNGWAALVLLAALILAAAVLFTPWYEPFHRVVELLSLFLRR